jgi:hypothetical protein
MSTGAATSQAVTTQGKSALVRPELEPAPAVVPEPPAPLRLVPDEATVTAGTEQPFGATAVDQRGNETSVTGQTDFTIEKPGKCTKISTEVGVEVRCSADKAKVYTVTGTLKDLGPTVTGTLRQAGRYPITATATLTVVPGPPTKLKLAPPKAEIPAGAKEPYTAVTEDRFGNETDVTGQTNFRITGPGPGDCPRDQLGKVSCTATKVGDYTVTGTLKEPSLSATATLTVVPGPPKTLTLKPNPETVPAGTKVAYTAVRVDQHGNETDVTGQTDFRIDKGGSCDGASCSATKADVYTVTGTLKEPSLSATATLTVVPGPPKSLELAPPKKEIPAGVQQPYTAVTKDEHGNQTDVTGQISLSIDPPSSCAIAGTKVSCTKTGSYTVTGTLKEPSLSAIATLTVVPGPATRLRLDPEKAEIQAGTGQPYTAVTEDRFGNETDLTAQTDFTIDEPGTCTKTGAKVSCTATKAQKYTVTGTLKDPSLSATATLTVLPGPTTSTTTTSTTTTTTTSTTTTTTTTPPASPPVISSVQPGFTVAGTSVEVGGNTGSCNRAGTLTFHGMTGDVSVKVTADQQGNFIARFTVPKGTFPRAYNMELTVDCNGQLQRAQAEVTVLNLAPVAADDSASTPQDTPVAIAVTANDRNPDPDTGYQTLVVQSSPPTHGTTEVRSDQTVVYTPEKGFVGQDRFQYGFCDDIINAAGSADCGTATVTVTVTATAPHCVPSAGDTPRLQVRPSKGPGGVRLDITATVDRRLATCPFKLLLGGTPLDPDVRPGPDGTITAQRGVPNNAIPGLNPVRLAAMSGQILAEAPFQIVPPPPPLPWPLKLLIGAGALLAGALARAALRRWRPSQGKPDQRELAQPEDVRVEPHARPVDATVEPELDHTRTFTVRLEPHHDPGTQTLQEMTP